MENSGRRRRQGVPVGDVDIEKGDRGIREGKGNEIRAILKQHLSPTYTDTANDLGVNCAYQYARLKIKDICQLRHG